MLCWSCVEERWFRNGGRGKGEGGRSGGINGGGYIACGRVGVVMCGTGRAGEEAMERGRSRLDVIIERIFERTV